MSSLNVKPGVTLAPDASILLLRLDTLGDCVMSTGFFAGLRQFLPHAHLTGAFNEATAPLFEACPFFDRVVALTRGGFQTWHERLEPPYDVVICPRWDVDHWQARRYALTVGAPVRIGFDRVAYRHDEPRDGWAGAYFTHLLRVPSALHEVEKGYALLEFLGAAGLRPKPLLQLPEAALMRAEDIVRALALDQFVALGVSAGRERRIWPTENFLPVIDVLTAARPGLRFVVIGGADAAPAARLLTEARPAAVVDATDSLPVASSAALLARAALYIGMDTGPMHLAAAGEVPVVEISCHPGTGSADHPNAPARFGPYATRSRILQPARPLSPCTDGCESGHEPHCIRQITSEQVVQAALELL